MLSSRVIFVCSLALVAAACGSGYQPLTYTYTDPRSRPVWFGNPVTIPGRRETLGNRAFNPDALDVAVGTTVTWTNTDSISHTSTSDGADGTPVQSRHVASSRRLSNAGTFPYHCSYHPGMVGTVTVH